MSDVGKRDVERLLRAHYRAERGAPDEMSKAAALAAVRAAVASEQRSSASAEAAAGATVGERSREATFAGFVAAQARFIHPRVWVAQLALVAVMAVLCLPSSGMAHGIPVVSGMLAAATVLVGLPELGCSDVVTVTAIALAAPVMLGADPFASLVHACVPYFLSCAGALLVARRCPSSQALALSCAWALLVIAGTYAAFSLVPDAYAQASTWAWALVAAGSLGWAAHEVRTWIRGIEGGLDVFAPASAAR